MREFEETDIRDVKKKIDDGVGFVVGDHNFGRVDRMTEAELTAVAKSAGRLIEQAAALVDAITLETFKRLGEQSDEENV